jgi:hypothetical protein
MPENATVKDFDMENFKCFGSLGSTPLDMLLTC